MECNCIVGMKNSKRRLLNKSEDTESPTESIRINQSKIMNINL